MEKTSAQQVSVKQASSQNAQHSDATYWLYQYNQRETIKIQFSKREDDVTWLCRQFSRVRICSISAAWHTSCESNLSKVPRFCFFPLSPAWCNQLRRWRRSEIFLVIDGRRQIIFGPGKCSSGLTRRCWPKYGQRKRRASSLTLFAVGNPEALPV